MENITSPGFETTKETESTNSGALSELLASEDDLQFNDAFSDDEASLLKEDFMTPGMGNIFEDDAISLPSEDSLYHLDEYFTLRNIHHTKKHY